MPSKSCAYRHYMCSVPLFSPIFHSRECTSRLAWLCNVHRLVQFIPQTILFMFTSMQYDKKSRGRRRTKQKWSSDVVKLNFCPHINQNDPTLRESCYACQFPILTAAYLQLLKPCWWLQNLSIDARLWQRNHGQRSKAARAVEYKDTLLDHARLEPLSEPCISTVMKRGCVCQANSSWTLHAWQ